MKKHLRLISRIDKTADDRGNNAHLIIPILDRLVKDDLAIEWRPTIPNSKEDRSGKDYVIKSINSKGKIFYWWFDAKSSQRGAQEFLKKHEGFHQRSKAPQPIKIRKVIIITPGESSDSIREKILEIRKCFLDLSENYH